MYRTNREQTRELLFNDILPPSPYLNFSISAFRQALLNTMSDTNFIDILNEIAGKAISNVKILDSRNDFPIQGDLDILYFDMSSNILYSWNGENYIPIQASGLIS